MYKNPNYQKEYKKKHKKEIKEYNKNYREEHKKELNEKSRKWNKENPEKVKKNHKKWAKKNHGKVKFLNREYSKKRRKTDPQYRLNSNIARTINDSIKGKKEKRHWEDLVGYTLQNLIIRLEFQFDDKINWENYGSYWWIDHKKPQSLFHFNSAEEQAFKDCWCLANLQPMEKIENIKKSNHF